MHDFLAEGLVQLLQKQPFSLQFVHNVNDFFNAKCPPKEKAVSCNTHGAYGG